MVLNETSFPRGGVAHIEGKADDSQSNIIFGATQKKIKKASKPKDSILNDANDDNDQLQAISAESLTFDTLQEDMLVMGVVKEAGVTSLDISLPGRMTARALVADISEAYTRVAKQAMQGETSEYNELSALFNVGRIVYGRVIKTQKLDGKRITLLLTLKPADVHSGLVHTNIKKGFIFTGAITEIQEHGYVIETGIQGLQAFVAQEQQTQTRHIGELAFLKVKQIQHNTNQSTCTCVEVEQHKLKIKSQNEHNLDYILPGSIVKFKVGKLLKNGLQGHIMNESFTAYANEHHLAEPLQTPDDYEVNEEYEARVLYVMPLTKLVYLTLNLSIKTMSEAELATDADDDQQETSAELLKKGSIVEKARVIRLGTGGVVLTLNKQYKGLISYGSIKANFKGNYDQDEVLAKYARKTKHKVRVLGYDAIDALYYCSDDPNVVNEKLYTLEDIKAGDLVSARIVKREEKISGYSVKIGKVYGIIEQLYLAPNVKYEIGLRLRCRVVDVNAERKMCYVTNRTEYLSKSAKLLTTLPAAQVGNLFTGTVVKCEPTYVLVKFCNGIKGVLHKQRLEGFMASSENTFFEGQTIKFRIYGKNKEQITLTLPEDKFKLGEICPIEVTNTLDAGLEIKITLAADEAEDDEQPEQPETEEFVGLVPLRLLSDHPELLLAQKRILPLGTHTEAACIVQNIFSLRDVSYFSDNLTKDWHSVQVGDVLRSFVKHASAEVLELLVPVLNYNKLVKVHVKMLRLGSASTDVPIALVPEQVLYVKVLSKENETRTLTVSAKLTDVWSGHLNETAQFVESYLAEVARIKKALKKSGAAIGKHVVGEKISVIFKGIDPDTHDWVYTLEQQSNITALLKCSFTGTSPAPEVGSKQQAVILWIDYASDLLYISNKKLDIDHITSGKQLPENLVAKAGMKAKVLLKLDSIVICSLKKGANPLVYCPVRLHYNDVEHTASMGLRQGDFCNLAFIHEKLPIALPEAVWKLWKNVKRAAAIEAQATAVKAKKARLEEEKPAKRAKRDASPVLTNGKQVKLENIKPAKTNGQQFFEDKAPAKRATKLAPNAAGLETAKVRLPGVTSFWETDLTALNGQKEAASSAEEDEPVEEELSAGKKKRLSAKEKVQAQMKEERRLREIEERNADPTQRPETIDQFERLALAEPNSSKCWIEYIAFLLSNTEIEKARAVARRAIKTIVFRETGELLNVWSALLNLELIYNTNQFDEVLKEALTCNDPLEIYMRTVDILKKAQRQERLLEILAIMLRKFKTEPKVWRLAAEAYFAIGLADRVQPTLQRALSVLPNQQHIDLIVAYSMLYAKHDDNAMAQTLLDDIVTSYPKRIDIWVLYVDMLIKTGLIESARNVLERAVLQKLRPNKMVVIYKKYLDFEERHGTEANAAKVKQMAQQYVKSYNNAA